METKLRLIAYVRRGVNGLGGRRRMPVRSHRRLTCWFAGVLGCLAGCGGGSTSSEYGQPATPPTAPPPVAVTVAPLGSILLGGATQQFVASVNGLVDNTAVTWSVLEGQTGGSISGTGLLTTSRTPGYYHVVATSVAGATTKVSFIVIHAALVQSGFTFVASLTDARAAHTATVLPSGKVLVAGGGYMDIDDLLVPIDSIELFDPSAGTFAPAGRLMIAREFHTATLLTDGTVLIAGGSEFNRTAELYDPGTGLTRPTGTMTIRRSGHTATLLRDGRVLVAGGSTSTGGAVASAELYDPLTATFSQTGSMSVARSGHTATMLASGKVLITGGTTDGIQSMTSARALASAEIYDPQSGSFTSTGPMVTARAGHTATLLTDGTVLVAGGANSAPLASTELYDPAGRFLPGASMTMPRTAHTATVLPNGKILVAGGIPAVPAVYVGYAPTPTAEIYDPAGAGSFALAGNMADGRFWHSAMLLRDGRVLVVGGGHSDAPFFGADVFPTAETYP